MPEERVTLSPGKVTLGNDAAALGTNAISRTIQTSARAEQSQRGLRDTDGVYSRLGAERNPQRVRHLVGDVSVVHKLHLHESWRTNLRKDRTFYRT